MNLKEESDELGHINPLRPRNVPWDTTLALMVILVIFLWFLESKVLLCPWNMAFLHPITKLIVFHPSHGYCLLNSRPGLRYHLLTEALLTILSQVGNPVSLC